MHRLLLKKQSHLSYKPLTSHSRSFHLNSSRTHHALQSLGFTRSTLATTYARQLPAIKSNARTLVSVPRMTFALLRIPVAAVSAGMGVSAYIHYKVTKLSEDLVPDWLKTSAENATQWLSEIDLSGLKLPSWKFGTEDGALSTDPIIALNLPDVMPDVSLFPSANMGSIKQTVDTAREAMFGTSSVQFSTDASMASIHPKTGVHNATSASSSVGQDNTGSNQDLLGLTSKLIDIRNLLKTIDRASAALNLPSIVVVGSQSSGKSSVLEAVVGHEFLPKGANMVTRRPIELTLIHTPDSKEEYSEFPQLGLGKIKDFSQVRRTLTDLNLAVSDAECVSEIPIELRVYSPNIPDLTLVDLPGYIQIHTKDQPPILKEKIAALCQKYIQEPNIILAVCAADVDLANSEALRASRKIDPLGLRTIGVITKMDLVEPQAAVNILENKSYPLALGYIGVVNKTSSRSFSQALTRQESYFRSHPEFNNAMVGTATLRRRLVEVLEEHMGRSLHSIVDACQSELDNARYEFKVQYNDRSITAESYVAESMDILKQNFRRFTQEFGKPQVREHIRDMLESKMLKICSDIYWSDEFLSQLPREALESPYWQNKLDISSALLTKSGVGKSTVQLVVNLLTSKMEDITSSPPWSFHDEAREQILQFSAEILRSKFHTTVDQVENTIKPYKFEVDCTDLEWHDGQKRAATLLESQIIHQQAELQEIKSTIGRRRLRNTIKQVNKLERDAAVQAASSDSGAAPAQPSTSSFSFSNLMSSSSSLLPNSDDLPDNPLANSKLLEKARQALQIQSGLATIQQRLTAVKSRQCSLPENKVACPEVYLSVVSEKLAYTSVMFIYLELLSEFFFHMPREMDNRMYYGLSRAQIRKFARENPSVMKHLDTIERKATLEVVMEKLKTLTRNGK
ncbi:mitochondrial dynamin GTPase Msp1 [Batrachochytrium dendrobatidis]|nr:mitochondrial dynamin GTPase Msp1 [Batrachochytrium dendrobatidis]KAK5669849.1 mitochondrial dynamin GTPase Msp1 [Batrachochytrium dendrobatidis]